MWARLKPDGIDIIHLPVEIWTDTIHHSKAIFEDWTAQELFQHVAIVPATYADAPPSPGHIMTSETPILQPDNTVVVLRTWAEPPPVPVLASPVAAPIPPAALDMATILQTLEEINEAKAFVPGADPARFPLLAARAKRDGLSLELAAVRVIDSLAQIKGAA